MKRTIILTTALVMAVALIGQHSMTVTYTEGDLPTDRLTNWDNLTSCPGVLTAEVPEGHMVTSIDLAYSMTALNWGWISDQRSKLISPNLDAGETEYVAGTGSGNGTFHYNRPGLDFANFATGEIIFELHAGRTFGSNWGCTMADQKVDNNSWQITIHYTPIPACMYPYNLAITDLSNVSAGIAWQQLGTVDSWDLVYGFQGFDPENEGELLTGISVASHTLPELEPYTHYDVYVRANCGADGLSNWSDVLGFQTFSNPLSGTYTINQNEPTENNNFSSFVEFAHVINTGGLAGPVVVNVVEGSGPYEEQVIFGAFIGSSPENTLTINGNDEELVYTSEDSQQRATLKMDGTSHVQINDLAIKALGTFSIMEYQYGYGVQLMNNAQHLIFDNCHFVADKTSTSTVDYTTFLASNSHTGGIFTGLAASNTTISNSIFEGGYYGVLINGPASEPYAENNQIINCAFVDFRNYGLYTSNQHDMIIHGNSFSRPTRPHHTNVDMIYFTGQMGGTQITNNHIDHFFYTQTTSAAHGIRGSWFSAEIDKPMLIANNHIAGFNNMNGLKHGIFLRNNFNQGYINMYHNTILMHNPDYNNNQTVSCFYHNGGGAVLDVRNNVFSYTSNTTGWKTNIFFAASNITLNSDNNVLHQGSINQQDRYAVVWTNAHTYTLLEDWQYVREQDLNSVDNDPLFINPDQGNLLPTNGAVSKIGADLSAIVPHDITGQLRTVPPDPGAYEFEPLPCLLPSQSVVSNVGLDHATVSWVPNGNEELWEISYGALGFEPDEGTIVGGIDETPYLLQGLDHSTMYELYIRADCGDELKSIWAGPIPFSTLCWFKDLPYVQNFEDVIRPDLPICWEMVINSTTNEATIVATGAERPHSPPNHIRFNNSYDQNAELIVITPEFEEDMEGRTVFFWAKSDDQTAVLEVGTITADEEFILHEMVDLSRDYTYYHTTFGPNAAGHHRIGFKHGTTDIYQRIYLDNVTVADLDYAGSVSGTVTNPSGQAVPDARVFTAAFETYTDAIGFYEVNNLVPDNYEITIEKGGFAVETYTASVQTGEPTTNDMAFTYANNEFPLSFAPRSTIMFPLGSFFYNAATTNGTHLYISANDMRLHTYDITNPDEPQLLSSLDVVGLEALFYNDHLFAGNGNDLLVYSLTNPAAPELIQTLELNGNLLDMHFNGTRAYALVHTWQHNAKLVVLELAGQEGVEIESSINISGGSSSYMLFVPERNLLYIHGLSPWETYTISIVDVSDAANPSLTWSLNLPYANSRMAAYPNHIILGANIDGNGVMMAYSTHDPTEPVLVKEQLMFENHFINEISALDGTLMTFVRDQDEITSLTALVYDEFENHFYRGSTLREGYLMPVARFNFQPLDQGRFSQDTKLYWALSAGVSFYRMSSYSDRYRDYEIEKLEEDCDPGTLTITIIPAGAVADGCFTFPAAGVTHEYPCTPVMEGLLATAVGDWTFKEWHGAPPGNPTQKEIEGNEVVVAEFTMAILNVTDQMNERPFCVNTIVEEPIVPASTITFTALGDDWILGGFNIWPFGTGHDADDIETVLVYAPGPIHTQYPADNTPLHISITPPILIEENSSFTAVVNYTFDIDEETYARDTTQTFGFTVSAGGVTAEPANFPVGRIQGEARMNEISIGRVMNNNNMMFATIEQAVEYTDEGGLIILCPVTHETNAVIDKTLSIEGWEGMRDETLVSPSNPVLPVFHLKPGAAQTRFKEFTITE